MFLTMSQTSASKFLEGLIKFRTVITVIKDFHVFLKHAGKFIDNTEG